MRQRDRETEKETEEGGVRGKRQSETEGQRDRGTVLRRECNLLTAVKGFKVDLEASRT